MFEELGVNGIHLDIMDGIFVPRFGLHLELIQEIIKTTKLPTEIHLMSVQPELHIPKLVGLGSKRIIIHIESTAHPHRVLSEIKANQVEAGVALNPSTQISTLEYLTDVLDYVLLMSINPGVPKHPIINSTFSKLASLREFLDNVSSDKEIGLDGGVDFNNMKRLYELGANVLVGGSGTIFSNLYDVRENIREVMKIKKGN